MTWIIGLLTARGASPALAKAISYAGLALLVVGALWGAKCAYDRSVIDKHNQKLEQRAKPATDKAAAERARDTINNTKREEELHNAIASQPDQPISPTSRALSCERLRRVGRTSPACR